MDNPTHDDLEEANSPLAKTLMRILKRTGAASLSQLVSQVQSRDDMPFERASQCLQMLRDKGAVHYDKDNGLWSLSPTPPMN